MAGTIWDELDSEQEIVGEESFHEVPPSLLACVPGNLIWNDCGSVYVCSRSYPISAPGQPEELTHDPALPLRRLGLVFPKLPSYDNLVLGDCVFLDSETTGLGFNAMPFMIGVGTFEEHAAQGQDKWASQSSSSLPSKLSKADAPEGIPTQFVVRQLFAHHPYQESAVLQHLQDLLAGKRVCVSFNGDSFDIPLIRARFEASSFHFPELPLEDPFQDEKLLSLDLLPLARKIWRKRIGSCALSNCESRILGLKRTHADVAGAQIPGIYLKYLHDGKADELSRVFYHNRQDIVSMSFLLKSLIRSSESVASTSLQGLSGEEALSLGILLLRESRWSDAERLLIFATRKLGGSEHHAASFRELALHYKRGGHWENAKEIWEEWLSATVQDCVDPYVELAKYYEWRTKDILQAEVYTRWAIHVHRSSPVPRRSNQVQDELRHRLQRLQRKKLAANEAKC